MQQVPPRTEAVLQFELQVGAGAKAADQQQAVGTQAGAGHHLLHHLQGRRRHGGRGEHACHALPQPASSTRRHGAPPPDDPKPWPPLQLSLPLRTSRMLLTARSKMPATSESASISLSS
jgi:hypothetical protein